MAITVRTYMYKMVITVIIDVHYKIQLQWQ